MTNRFSIAIDGPGGAGKSSAAKEVAARLNAVYLDTGAMYRAVGLYMTRHDIDIHNAERVACAAADAMVDIRYIEGNQRVFLCGDDVTDKLRKPEISAAASAVSAVSAVRKRLVAAQREIAEQQNVVMDGRDTGTKVLPNATIKIFLTADVKERARRRYEELRAMSVTFERVLSDLIERDHNDSTRADSPLMKAEDAVEIDTTNLSGEEVVEAILALVREKCGDWLYA